MVNGALALIEIGGWSSAMVILDAMEKTAGVQVLQTELTDRPGVSMKLVGPLADIEAAARAAEDAARSMQTDVIAHVIPSPSDLALPAIEAPREFSPLTEQ